MAKRRTGTARAQVGLQMDGVKEFENQLNKFAKGVANEIAGQALLAAVQPIENAMIALAPESEGSRERQSKATRQRWSGTRKLKTTIKSVLRTKRKFGVAAGILALVGADYKSGGGHANLFAQRTHTRTVLWGKEPAAPFTRLINQFVKRASDQNAALSMMILKRELAARINTHKQVFRG